jgi:hypothetical protein
MRLDVAGIYVNDVSAESPAPGMCEMEWTCPSGSSCGVGKDSKVRLCKCSFSWSLKPSQTLF